MQSVAIGIDVGGTGIKGAAIETTTGELLTSRHRVATPEGGAPGAIAREVAGMVAAIRDEFAELDPGFDARPDSTPVGIALPGVVRGGIMLSAANVDGSWIGVDADALFAEATGAPCHVVNDADAAGVAEAAFGAVRALPGMTMVLTFGTGVGSACIYDGVLVPNFELGHLHLDGHPDIERYVSPKNIALEGLTIREWADRVARYLRHLEHVLNPDRFVIGGSISKSADEYLPFAGVAAPIVPAEFRNNAGIVGAAWLASRDRAS